MALSLPSPSLMLKLPVFSDDGDVTTDNKLGIALNGFRLRSQQRVAIRKAKRAKT